MRPVDDIDGHAGGPRGAGRGLGGGVVLCGDEGQDRADVGARVGSGDGGHPLD